MASQKPILIAVGAIILLLLAPSLLRAATVTTMQDALTAGAQLIAQFEGFRANPYWDVSRYSWGYGTPAPGPTGTITPEQGMQDLYAHATDDYNALAPRLTRDLSINQWSALLSFAYEEGHGNPGAGALVNDINAGYDDVLETHWKKYVYAGGVVDPEIVDRRNKEWDIWVS
jgi:GH24 family phage-related lysozyme (muramidase)